MVTKEFIQEQEAYLKSLYKHKDSKLTSEDIQDLVQDTFEKVTLYQDYYINDFDTDNKIPPSNKLRAWLKLVTVQVYDRYKRGMLQIEEIVNDYSQDDLLTPYSNYFYTTHKEEIDELINLLPENQRKIVYFKLILGYTHQEIASKLRSNSNAVSTMFSRGLDNLKTLINSDNPESEIMYEPKTLKPYGDKPYEGEWWWRYGENEERRNSKWYVYTNEELIAYCTQKKVNYNIKERNL